MKPYFQEGDISVYLGDCREVLPHVGRFDLLLCDPPYGIDRFTKPASRIMDKFGRGDIGWDVRLDDETLGAVIGSAEQAIIWGGNYYELPPNRCFLIWDKNNYDRDFADCEYAWTNLDAVARIHKERPMNMDGGKVHPTQKPLALMLWCISKAKNPQSVIDPFLGSGTTLVACKKLGIRGVGIEKEEKYCEIAVKRILNTTPSLFSEEK